MERFIKSGSSLNLQWYRDAKNTFKMVLLLLLLNDAVGAETPQIKAVSVKEGKDVALRTGETELKTDDRILWIFGDERKLLAEINEKKQIFETYDTDDKRFGGKLELDTLTGSLVIRNTQSTHSGVYHLKIIKKTAIVYKRFHVNVIGEGKAPQKIKRWEALLPHDIVKTVSSFMFAGLIGLVIITCCFWCTRHS
ncbi:hypothetical protein QQF64_019895 [Cirrhinus molitorella]|uniref:Immunoglobulin V-set domain-containing protein n=1 Tax=Cirrhinus molitorella TaxID=172907 RepID=A0ABR3LK21_9TELE